MDRDTIVYNNIWKDNHKYMDVSAEVMDLARISKQMIVLDLCAGGGRNTIPLLKEGHKVTAVDRNQTAISELNKIKQYESALQVIKSDAVEFLQKNKKKYDFIIVFDCIHHFCDTVDELLSNLDLIIKSLNLNGHLLISFLTNIKYPGGNENVKRL